MYSLALHPKLDVLMTGGRDSVCRVWDMRTKVQVHCLSGHDQTVCSILSQATDPQVCERARKGAWCGLCVGRVGEAAQGQGAGRRSASGGCCGCGRHPRSVVHAARTHVHTCMHARTHAPAHKYTRTHAQVITGSHDSTIRLWDLRSAKTMVNLTYHKKSVRAMALHPEDYAFASARCAARAQAAMAQARPVCAPVVARQWRQGAGLRPWAPCTHCLTAAWACCVPLRPRTHAPAPHAHAQRRQH